MRFLFLCLLAISGCSLVAAAPSRRASYVMHEKRAAEPVDWHKTRRLEAHRVLPLRIGLTQQNIHELEELLMSVSHPDSPTFGQHWSPERVIEHFAPSEATTSEVELLLDTEYHVYTHPSGHEQISSCSTAVSYPRISGLTHLRDRLRVLFSA